MIMSLHHNTPGFLPEVAPKSDLAAEKVPEMSPILLGSDSLEHDDRAKNVLVSLVRSFNNLDVPLLPESPDNDAARYKTRTRTLESGTSVTVRWGVSGNGLETLADAKISGKAGTTEMDIALVQQNTKNRYTIKYGTTVVSKKEAKTPDEKDKLITAFVRRARELLGDDVVHEEAVATSALKRKRTPRRKNQQTTK